MAVIGRLDDPTDVRILEKPEREAGETIRWYRPKLPKEVLAELNRKSDLKAFIQTGGYLGLLVLTGSAFVYSCLHMPWLAIPALLFHGMCSAFLINGFHELVHESVFRTKWLNGFFLQVFSFLGLYNHIAFWASHTEHHRYTLHQPDDFEEVVPKTVDLRNVLKFGIVDLNGIKWTILGLIKTAKGELQGDWQTYLFTKKKPEMRGALQRWAQIVLVGHALIAVVSIATGYWPVAIAVTFGRFFGSGVHFLCNSTQHIGLTDAYPDFRVCCRTITLGPFLSFLYWNMNFHTEHHMFAGVPCYNLPRLHKLIKHEMPVCPHGLIATWKQIVAIQERQKLEPNYQYFPDLPVVSKAADQADIA